MDDVNMRDGMATGKHMEHGQANVFPISPGEVLKLRLCAVTAALFI